jgi:glycyl-tRNA synthetase
MKNDKRLENLTALCKRRGFIFPGSEIYGGLANTWDYGPYGIELKKNIKDIWWKHWVNERDDIVGLDAAILMNPKTWEASGHIGNFNDPLVDCKSCKTRHRGDALIEEKLGATEAAKIKLEDISTVLKTENINCPACGKNDWATAKQFNLMFKTHQGVTDESGTDVYLRPETAQGIFVNFKNITDSCRVKIPFGVAQIGKSFRNEITPGNLTFRTREFEQMEVEYFIEPGDWEEKFAELEKHSWDFFLRIGVKEENLRWRKHDDDELSHYSALTKDIEYKFPWGFGELQGLAYRSDYDLKQHQKFSGQKLEYRNPVTNESYVPHCIEPSFGGDRSILTVLLDAYTEETVNENSTRTVLKLNPVVAPVKIAVFPLVKNKPELQEKARGIYKQLTSKYICEYDDNSNIGKRYRRQDEIGTPFCVTIDYDTLDDDSVTIRDRDSLEQVRISSDSLMNWFQEKLSIL